MPTRALVTSYRQDLELMPDRWHKVGMTLATVILLGFPFVASSHWMRVGNDALVVIVGSLGMMILSGFCGQISLGHAAFLAVGAYTAGVVGEAWHLPFWLAVPLSGLVAAAVGLAVGPFALRLRGLYLAIVTIGLLYLVNHTLLSFPELTGGVSGLAVPMHSWFSDDGTVSSLGAFTYATEIGPVTLAFEQKLYFFFLLIVLLSALATKNLQRSNAGRAMMAVRDHDIAASVLGVDPAKAKIISFGISSFFGGLAGSMFAFQQQYITVSPPFDLSMSVAYIAIVVIGGMGSTFGAVWGALLFVVLSPLTELVGGHIPLVRELTSAQQSALLFSLIVGVFLIFEPLGMLGIWLRIKRYFMAWPFRY